MARREEKLLESVIAVAEELSFSRASRKVRLSQPTISRNISEIEKELGFKLFERNHRTVKLTDAGRAFVEEARVGVLHRGRAFDAARAVMENAETVLNVGKSPYVDPFLVTTLLSIRLPLFPRLRINLSSQFSFELAHEVLEGELDLVIANEPPESGHLTTVKIGESPFYIAMSEEHELAYERSLTLESLGGRRWILFDRRMHPLVYDAVIKLAERRGVKPARIEHVIMPEEAFPLVVDGSAVAFVVKSGALRIARDGVTVRPLAEETLTLKTYLASRADDSSRVVSELVRAFMRKLMTFNKVQRNLFPVTS
jgi:DNA-binding transcriptional LysR family regulator